MMANPFSCIWSQIKGQDRVEESHASLTQSKKENTTERIKVVEVLERNSRDSARNLRAAKLYEAAAVESERARALAAQRRRLEEIRNNADKMRIGQIARDYGLRRVK